MVWSGGWWRQQLDAAERLGISEQQLRASASHHDLILAHNPATTATRPRYLFHTRDTHIPAEMDSLVAQYSRPADAEEGLSEQEQLELYSGAPELSLKFALPPVAQVCSYTRDTMYTY
jgi:hypothetical protein